MFLTKEYGEPDLALQKELIKSYPLGTLVTGNGPNGLNANHLPFVIREDPTDPEKFYLIGHFHKENPCGQDLQYAADHDEEVLIIFQGYDRYCTPSWYPSKLTNEGRVAPTWLYSAVHCYGKPTVIKVQDNDAGLHSILKQESQQLEAAQTDKPKEAHWDLDESPEPYLNRLKNMIYGLSIQVTRTEGKWKLNQKQKKEDIQGTADNLKNEADQRPESAKMGTDVEVFAEKYLANKKF